MRSALIGRVLLGLALLGITATGAHAQPKCTLGKLAELPVRMEGLRPLVSVEVNGQPTTLMLDTGAFFSAVQGPTAAKLGLRLGPLPPGMSVRGAGGAADYKVGQARTFKFAQAEFGNTDFLVGGPSTGPYDGLLGQNVLGRVDVEYDLANGVVRLFKPQDCKTANLAYWGAGKPVQVLNLEATTALDPHHVAPAKINGRAIRVMFDTGAPTSILKRSAAVRVGFSPTNPGVQSSGITRGVGTGGFETWNAPFESFQIADEEIKNTRLRVGDMQSGEDMILGSDFFLSHRIYISNSQKKMYFTHNGGAVFRLRDNATTVEASGARDDLADAGAYSRRAAASAARLDFAGAAADLDKAIALAPDDAQHYYDRALVHVRSRQWPSAMTDIEKALALRPGHAPSLLVRGRILLLRGNRVQAKADFDAIRRSSPEDYDIRLQIADAYAAAGAFPDSIAEYDAWIAANPKDPHLATFLNARCWKRGLWGQELDKALDDCNQAVRLSRDSNAIDSRALIYLRMGEFERAVREYDASLRLQPRSAWSLYGRGLAKIRLGKAAEGQADLAAARAINPALPAEAARHGLTP